MSVQTQRPRLTSAGAPAALGPVSEPFVVFPSQSASRGPGFPIDRTATEFYSAIQLRDALLHHPGAEKDKKSIYIESASYCRQQQKGAREFILFNTRSDASREATSTVLLLDPSTTSHTSSPASRSEYHSAQCLPLIFNLIKPSFWRSLKDPGRFYVPNEGCLENVLESRGLAVYQELEKIVFEDENSFDLESFVVLASTIASPSSLYQKKLAQTPFWFPVILWNLMKHFPSRIALMPRAVANTVPRLDSVNVDRLLKKFHVELARFRIELGGARNKRDEMERRAQRRQQSLLIHRSEIDAEREKAVLTHRNNQLSESSRQMAEENARLKMVLAAQRKQSVGKSE